MTCCGTCTHDAPVGDAMSLWRLGWVRYFENGTYIWICPACEPKGFDPDAE